MAAQRDKQLSTLLRALHRDPNNLDTLNSLAVWYFLYQPKGQVPLVDVRYLSTDDVRLARELNELENGSEARIIKACDYFEHKVYDYFARAYGLQRTVKSTHNFAWFLFYERGEEERGLEIQRQCLALEPRSVYPYYLYGRMLWNQNRYREAVPYFTAAYEREQDHAILHSIGVCYAKEGDFQKAKACFATIIEAGLDSDDNSTFNLALMEYKIGNSAQARGRADTIASSTKTMTDFSPSDLADLYFVLDDYRRAFECLSAEGFQIYEQPGNSWSYAIYVTDESLWRERVRHAMEERLESIAELSSNDVRWSAFTDEEKQNRLSEYQSELDEWNGHLQNGFPKPTVDLMDQLRMADYGCIIFDCPLHQTRGND